jgi:hypothetical protein
MKKKIEHFNTELNILRKEALHQANITKKKVNKIHKLWDKISRGQYSF